jgi:RNA exonuclease 1
LEAINPKRQFRTMLPTTEAERALYTKLARYVMSENDLKRHGYPEQDSKDPGMRVARGKDGQIMALRNQLAPSYECYRCKQSYEIGADGRSLPSSGICIYHPKSRGAIFLRSVGRRGHICCERPPSDPGCCSNKYHVHFEQPLLENYRGYVQTQPKPELEPDRHGVYALDCAMCHTTYDLELIRICVVNHDGQVVYDQLVKPLNPILDYNTQHSGITECDMISVNTTLADVQRHLLNLFSDKTIQVRHSLEHEMIALKLFHKRFVDTAHLYPHRMGLPMKRALRTLVKEKLGSSMLDNTTSGNDCKQVAIASLRLVKRRCL